MSEQQVGRVAFRVEGKWWVAYYAKTDSMGAALEMGRIAMGIVLDPDRKSAFMSLMRSAINDFLREATGVEPSWRDPVPAPESERSGSA